MITIGEILKDKQPVEFKKLRVLKTKLQYKKMTNNLVNTFIKAARNFAKAIQNAFGGASNGKRQ